MTEKEYRVQNFAQWAPALANRRIALYGVAANAKAILETYPDYPILCLIDDKRAGCYIDGKLVLTLEDAASFGIDTIIIAAQMTSAQAIYQRIRSFCSAHRIEVYDFYGKSMSAMQQAVFAQKADYLHTTLEKLEQRAAAYDVISFDYMNTLVACRLPDPPSFYRELGKAAQERGIVPEDISDLRCYGNLQQIRIDLVYEKIAARLNLKEEQKNALKNLEVELSEKLTVGRHTMIDLLNRLVAQGKKVYIVSDVALLSEQIEEILHREGYQGGATILARDASYSKMDLLLRHMREQEGDKKILHIGDDELEDAFAPMRYGMDFALVAAPFTMLQDMSKYRVASEQMAKTENVTLVGSFIAEVFNDPFCMALGAPALELTSAQAFSIRKVMAQNLEQAVVITQKPMLLPAVADGAEVDVLTVPVFEKPIVSVVIPVYNQFGYTYNCIKSIVQNSGDVPYEILIADDCSTDRVHELEKYVTGITVIHNEKNLRFLRNCNHAAEQARGDYILFLNNDTQVQPDWLAPLVALMEREPEAGMVGSKLIYPDGYLQEAGGIVWNDASAWNYGHRKDPLDCEYNYVREVDYISGAAIMIRADLWREIGGFDERFAPAYYEDTDLAFEVRKHGKKVLYQPLSVVVHFEGVSNGTDLSSGQKAYQVANREKFCEKWKDVLEKENYPNGTHVFQAKGRSRFRKHILVVDHYVPNYDKDAGGKCTYMYMKTFVKMGLEVTFIGDNFASPQPYTTELQQLGIHVLYGDFYYLNKEYWLMENLPNFEYVYLQRPHISIKYIDLVRQYSRAQIFYFAHDLAHIREMREYKITGDPAMLESSQKWKKIEYELFDKCDVGHVVGSYEQGIMQKAFPNKPIRNIPVYVYDDLPTGINKDFSTRKDLMFVGGFAHRPNGDAVRWFAKEVFPTVLQRYPDIKWYVIGSRVPDDILALANEHIIVTGFMPDEDLEKMYRTCRMAVVPLRYGAGVKGKVIESAYYQIPLVTTPIGAEGLVCDNGVFAIEEDAQAMAKRICDLYEDFDALREMSDKGKQFIESGFTTAAAEKLLRQDMRE